MGALEIIDEDVKSAYPKEVYEQAVNMYLDDMRPFLDACTTNSNTLPAFFHRLSGASRMLGFNHVDAVLQANKSGKMTESKITEIIEAINKSLSCLEMDEFSM